MRNFNKPESTDIETTGKYTKTNESQTNEKENISKDKYLVERAFPSQEIYESYSKIKDYETNELNNNFKSANYRTEEAFNEYTKKVSEDQEIDIDYVLQVSSATCLRYIKLKELICELENTSIKGRINRENFVGTVVFLAKENGLAIGAARIEEIENLYDSFRENPHTVLELKDLTGALSVLCSGKLEEKIRIGLNLSHDKISIECAVQFLESIYKLLLTQIPNSVKKFNIGPKELSKMTILQCFDDHKRAYKEPLTINEFIDCFLSQVKTLDPQCESTMIGNKSRTDISIIDEPKNGIDNEYSQDVDSFKIGPNLPQNQPLELSCNEEEFLYMKSDNPFDLQSAFNPCCKSITDKNQWIKFLNYYYSLYGNYPPPPPVFKSIDSNPLPYENKDSRSQLRKETNEKLYNRNNEFKDSKTYRKSENKSQFNRQTMKTQFKYYGKY